MKETAGSADDGLRVEEVSFWMKSTKCGTGHGAMGHACVNMIDRWYVFVWKDTATAGGCCAGDRTDVEMVEIRHLSLLVLMKPFLDVERLKREDEWS